MSLSEFALSNGCIKRSEAAKLVHEYIRDVLKEPDEDSIHGAAVLKDLYDCHVCANHIAQVYLKGIMTPISERVFGYDDFLLPEDLELIEMRIKDKSLRVKPAISGNFKASWIEKAEIDKLEGALIIDVRSSEAFSLNPVSKAACNIPLHKYVLNPKAAGADCYRPVVFVCTKGTNAIIAAESALEAGYKRVFFCGLSEE